MTAQQWGDVLILVACFVLSALASATETGLTSISRLRVRHLAEEGQREAVALQRLQSDPGRFLSTVLVVNTVALIVASSAATLLAHSIVPEIHFLGDLAVALALAIVLLIFAEVTPKSLAIRHSERVAMAAAGPVGALSTVLRPVLWFITGVTRAITGGRASGAPFVTERELLTLLHVSEEQGVIEEEEREMIHGIIEIGDKAVREVMVPRTDITAIEKQTPLDEIIAIFESEAHTRLPIYAGDLDSMVGLIHVKDLLMLLAGPARNRATFDIEAVMRPIKFTPESKKVDELLHQMQAEKVHMAVVLDEYGGTAGLVTLEDLLEEIVGEIRDEYDVAEEEPLTLISETEAVVDARFPMDALNSRLGLGVEESDDYDSVGGFVLATLGEVPETGATFEAGRVRWEVDEVSGQRILRLRLHADEPWPDDALVAAGLRPPAHGEHGGNGEPGTPS